jgi:Putative MetA-pathway of phenol degradation
MNRTRAARAILIVVLALIGSAATAHAQTTGKPPKPKPAEEAVDEELLARALERSLVLTGGVLVPRGQYEIEPGFQFDYTGRSAIGLVRRDNLVASLGLRVGLPWTSQLEFSVPYVRQKVEVLGAEAVDDSGIGDVQVGFSKELLGPTRGGTSVIGNITYQNASGDSNLALLANPALGSLLSSTSLGAGFDSIQATLTAVKRMDPLVFLGSFTHSFNRSTTAGGADIDPSDSNGINFRAILATSPTASLRLGFSLARAGELKVNGTTLPGSKQTVSLLELGGSVILTRRTLLDVAFAAGLTEDSPNFVLGISLPVRF